MDGGLLVKPVREQVRPLFAVNLVTINKLAFRIGKSDNFYVLSMLKNLTPLLQKVTEGKNLTAAESEEVFTTLEEKDTEGYFYFAFLAALHAKGETSDELLGFCRANEHFVPAFTAGIDPDSIIDVSGTGGDKIKTPNVSTAAAFVVASYGITVAKQAFFAVTGVSGSADLMQAFDVNPLAVSREGKEKITSILSKTGMVIYHANSMANPQTRKGYFDHWLKKVPETGLAHVTAYHLAANVYSPLPMRRRVYGVFDDQYLKPLAELFQKLGYTKVLLCHGVDGLDEISTIGATNIVELSKNKMSAYTIEPADMGLQRAQPDEVTIGSREESIKSFIQIMYGNDRGPKRDLVAANAAAAFYVMDTVTTLAEGVALANQLLDSGKVAAKLEAYVACCGNPEILHRYKY